MKKLLLLLALSAPAYAHDPLLPRSISSVYEYSCQTRYLEGEGMQKNAFTCPAFQHLGFYLVSHTFYLFQNAHRDNFQFQGQSANYANICGMADLDRYTCDQNPTIAFGLSEFAEGNFNVGVQLTAGPQGPTQRYGYAAQPDPFSGECEEGLMKVQAYRASPMNFHQPLPNNLPMRPALDSMQIAATGFAPEPFEVTRVPGLTPCNGMGYCGWPDGAPYAAAVAPYQPLEPSVCVIAPGRLKKK